MLYFAQLALLFVATMLAFWKGGWPERSIAVIMVAWAAADFMLHNAFSHAEIYEVVDLWHFTFDVTGFALFFVVALKADRIWPIWMCSLQFYSVAGHFIRMAAPEMYELVYAVFQRFPYWLEILLIIWGSLHQAWRAKVDDGREQSARP
ncbi:hypothetical protein [Pelagerythrobacter sp.]|uniref:hypothetical protein n=1 Tax=Pelagerythrobacter sp. TaxID=2800702 RepID=UPI0035B004BC